MKYQTVYQPSLDSPISSVGEVMFPIFLIRLRINIANICMIYCKIAYSYQFSLITIQCSLNSSNYKLRAKLN